MVDLLAFLCHGGRAELDSDSDATQERGRLELARGVSQRL